MSDEITSPDPPMDSAPASPTKRPWTILGRLSKAVREQNWFAVALELVIVVLGVIIGFQVTAWGQERANRATERTYLRQLAADLAETERIVTQRNARMAQTHAALDRLIRSFDAPERPPPDSVAAWLGRAVYVASPRPVLGTAEALVASGDFGSVADDSLRAAILRYLDGSREILTDQTEEKQLMWEAFTTLYHDHMDIRTVIDAAVRDGDAQIGASLSQAILALAPSQPWTPPYPVDVDALYDDPRFYRTLGTYVLTITLLNGDRNKMAEIARTLRQQVEATLDR